MIIYYEMIMNGWLKQYTDNEILQRIIISIINR